MPTEPSPPGGNPNEVRSIRSPDCFPRLSTKRDSQLNSMSWNQEPSPHPVSFWKPKGSVRGTNRDVFPLREASDPVGARSLLSTTLSREHEAAPHSPRTTPARTIGWLTGIVFFCERLGTFRPVAGGAPVLLTSESETHCVGLTDQKRVHALPLVVAYGVRLVWRHAPTSIDDHTQPKDLEFRAAPRRTTRTASPRQLPSELLSAMRALSWQDDRLF